MPVFPEKPQIAESLLTQQSPVLAPEPVPMVPEMPQIAELHLLADNPPLASLETVLDTAYPNDPLAIEILQALRDGARTNRQLSLADCREANSRRYYQNRLYVPEDPDSDLRL